MKTEPKNRTFKETYDAELAKGIAPPIALIYAIILVYGKWAALAVSSCLFLWGIYSFFGDPSQTDEPPNTSQDNNRLSRSVLFSTKYTWASLWWHNYWIATKPIYATPGYKIDVNTVMHKDIKEEEGCEEVSIRNTVLTEEQLDVEITSRVKSNFWYTRCSVNVTITYDEIKET